ncbi:hypothetical protein ACFY2T_29825 [Streptomyces sp. NPDC001260]|uniref:hypothetical protein n=1 Tax=Streptomyces sp. NPDC001260 TaxID=3364551 RepID=UPI0036856EFD
MHGSNARLDGSEAALLRADACDVREQDAIDREAAASRARQDDEGLASPQAREARAARLQRQLADVASALRATQETLADEYERIAGKQPELATEYRRLAEQPRQGAARLHHFEPARDGITGEEPDEQP